MEYYFKQLSRFSETRNFSTANAIIPVHVLSGLLVVGKSDYPLPFFNVFDSKATLRIA